MVATEVPQVPSKRKTLVGDLVRKFISGRSEVSVMQMSRLVPSPVVPQVPEQGVSTGKKFVTAPIFKGRAPLKSWRNCRGSGGNCRVRGEARVVAWAFLKRRGELNRRGEFNRRGHLSQSGEVTVDVVRSRWLDSRYI